MTNEALKEANIEARVDHRSLAEQGIDREPKPHIPFAAYKIERAGKHSDVAESIRADYNARVKARMEHQAEREPDAPASPAALVAPTPQPAPARQPTQGPQPTPGPQPAPTSQPAPGPPAAQDSTPKSLEDIRREARENWLKMRAAQQPAAAADTPAPPDDRERTAQQPADRGRTAQQPADRDTPTPTRTPDNDHQP